MDINLSLRESFGFEHFRPGQEQTIKQLLAGDSTLSIFPTGAGKSLCYQFTALQLPNLTLLVSPLLALMNDQITFLKQKGIPAASIDSTLTPEQNQQVLSDVRSGHIKILMVSVERFKNERFRQFIQSIKLSMLVIDEAHCISEWGHNFRPDYLKLPSVQQTLNIPLVLLLTATATRAVKQDMASKFSISDSHIVQTGFYRPNLDLSVLAVSNADKNKRLLDKIQSLDGSGIVYVTLQKTAEYVAEYLRDNRINAEAYHAGLKYEKRTRIQSDFMAGTTAVVVATIAFGMGIDKADIRFVAHYDLPKSIENYSQEIGRAGRDGQRSTCFTLANLDGINVIENFVYGDTPELDGIEQVLNHIRQMAHDGQWELLLMSLSNASNVRQLPLKTLLVQLELMNLIKPLYSYFAEFKYKLLKPQDEILNRFTGERRSFVASIFTHSITKKVWSNPDFEALSQQTNSHRGRAVTALEYLHEKQLIELEASRMTEVYEVDMQGLAEPALSQQLHQYFTAKETKEVKRIATLVRFFELDSCLTHNLSRYFDDQQSPESCGHCSVCRGDIAKLDYSEQSAWPDDQQLRGYLSTLYAHLSAKTELPITVDIYCRFLAGISVPLFARFKVRQFAGFASCETQRYQAIREKVASLQND